MIWTSMISKSSLYIVWTAMALGFCVIQWAYLSVYCTNCHMTSLYTSCELLRDLSIKSIHCTTCLRLNHWISCVTWTAIDQQIKFIYCIECYDISLYVVLQCSSVCLINQAHKVYELLWEWLMKFIIVWTCYGLEHLNSFITQTAMDRQIKLI